MSTRSPPPPLLLRKDGGLRALDGDDPALPLGMGALGTWPDRAVEAHFPSGSTFLFCTDGLSEARDERGYFYDPAARLAGRIFHGPDSLLSALAQEVRRYTGGGATDDMALLAVRRP